MRIKAGIPIKDYPPKLKELAIRRTLEEYPSRPISEILNLQHGCWSNFNVSSTPEGGEFWSNVFYGREFDWEEEKVRKFKRGDRVTYNSTKGYFVCYRTDMQECIIERDDTAGWKKSSNPRLIPMDYKPVKHESFWACQEGSLSFLQELEEEKKGNKWGFVPGDKITNGVWKGVYLRDDKYEDGICRLESGQEWIMSSVDWKKIETPSKALEVVDSIGKKVTPGNISPTGTATVFWEPDGYSWQYPSRIRTGKGLYQQLVEDDARRVSELYSRGSYHMEKSSTIEKLPTPIMVSRKKKKK